MCRGYWLNNLSANRLLARRLVYMCRSDGTTLAAIVIVVRPLIRTLAVSLHTNSGSIDDMQQAITETGKWAKPALVVA